MSDDAKDLRRQELAIGAVNFGPPSPLSLQDDLQAHELEAAVRGLAAEIRTKERRQDRTEGAREEREAVVRRLSESFGQLQASDPGRDLSVAYAWLCGELRAIEAGKHRKP